MSASNKHRQIRKPRIWNPIPPEGYGWIYVWQDDRSNRTSFYRNVCIARYMVPAPLDHTKEGLTRP